MKGGVGLDIVRAVYWHAVPWDNRASYQTPSSLSNLTPFASSISASIGVGDSGGDDVWSGGVYDPRAVGLAGWNGEMAVIPAVHFSADLATRLSHRAGHKTAMLAWAGGDDAAATAEKPRIGVNEIASVEWEQVDKAQNTNGIQLGDNVVVEYGDGGNSSGGGNNSGDSGGTNTYVDGLRCFPELDAPGGTLHNEINVKVTLAVPLPVGINGTVHLKIFDPDNPVGSTKTPRLPVPAAATTMARSAWGRPRSPSCRPHGLRR